MNEEERQELGIQLLTIGESRDVISTEERARAADAVTLYLAALERRVAALEQALEDTRG